VKLKPTLEMMLDRVVDDAAGAADDVEDVEPPVDWPEAELGAGEDADEELELDGKAA
jgi:hypothetical protein